MDDNTAALPRDVREQVNDNKADVQGTKLTNYRDSTCTYATYSDTCTIHVLRFMYMVCKAS